MYPADVEISHDSPATPSPLEVAASLEVENSPGTVALTSPADGESVLQGETIYFSADASDPDGIARVAFLRGKPKSPEIPPRLRSFTRHPSSGTHDITARMTDSFGLTTVSAIHTLHILPATDTDFDEMPDSWETANELNPDDSDDAAARS